MEANILIVSVDNNFYADCLERSLPVWKRHAETVTVVTDLRDERTPLVAHRFGAILHRTNIFYEGGRIFGKSAAMEEARVQSMPFDAWIIFTDADILPAPDWLDQVEAQKPVIGNLYGCRRELDDGSIKHEGEIGGFFQMFHVDDPVARVTPLLDTGFIHAGSYDSEFQFRWPKEKRVVLPMIVRHQGEHGKHWCGRGNDEAMTKIRNDRLRGKRWQDERVC